MSFIVASIRSRSRRSFSSSTVSTFLAVLGTDDVPTPVIAVPALSVNGRSFSFFGSGAGVVPPPPKSPVKPFQSMDRPRLARFSCSVSGCGAAGGSGAGAEIDGPIAGAAGTLPELTEFDRERPMMPAVGGGVVFVVVVDSVDLDGKKDDDGRAFGGGLAAWGAGAGAGAALGLLVLATS